VESHLYDADMNMLTKLEKNKSFLFLFIIFTLFFLLRLPSLAEPNWYGDEGIYQVIGQALNNGRILYAGIWDNKPPLLYIIYALFNGDQASIRFLSLISGITATIVLFFLAKKLFNKLVPTTIAVTLFTLLFATPYIEGNIANAENFMLLPIILAGLLIYQTKNHVPTTKRQVLFAAGLLLGIAFIFKIVAIFDLAAFLLFFWIVNLPQKLSLSFIQNKSFRLLILNSCFLILGFALPLLITILYFLSHHAFFDFIKATFFGNIGYVGYGNKLLNIPQGFLFLKLLLLAAGILFIFIKRNNLSKTEIFIILWFIFSLFNAFFSQRPYTHYLIVLLPSFCLLIGLLFTLSARTARFAALLFIMISLILIVKGFHLSGLEKTFLYYQNITLFITGHKSLISYQSFFDGKAPRDYELALFIKKHTKPSDNIFIWGNNAQIYALSHKLPPNKYTVAYHITQSKEGIIDTQETLNKIRPKYVITLSEAPLLPFSLPLYKIYFVFPRATIYEREL
jgi:hypothetical protein